MKIIGGENGNYILKNNGKMDTFLLSLIKSGILDELEASLIYDSKRLICLEFNAYSVENIESFFSQIKQVEKPNLVLRLLWCLNKQQQALQKFGFGIYNIDLRDIIVVNYNTFFLTNSDFSREIRDGLFLFNSPIRTNIFSCYSLNNIRSLPSKSDLDCFNFSLGASVFFLLTGKKYEAELNMRLELAFIYKTKLYWTILRCLEKRRLLYI
jgi:hypothetical protein